MRNGKPKVLVPVHGLSSMLEDRDEVYQRYVLGVRPFPSFPLVSGQFEHLARRMLVEQLRDVYLRATQEEDLRDAYPVLERCIEEAAVRCEREFGNLNLDLEQIHNDVLNRVRIEEDARVASASALLQDGVHGFDLVGRILPHEVELHIRSQLLGLEGSLDAVGVLLGRRFPIEYKTGRNPSLTPRDSHKIQVTAYCMLLEEAYETACHYGEIYYTRYFHRTPLVIAPAAKRRVLELREEFLEMCSGEASDQVIEEVVP